jgi:hypothetical protein
MPDVHSLSLPQIITGVGALGTAAFGLVDSTKALGGGINHAGFGGIRAAVTPLVSEAPVNSLSRTKIIATLQANWFNGNDLGNQKAIAKSLIKLNLSPASAAAVAASTGVDPVTFTAVATKMATGVPLTSGESDVYARWDLIVTAILDEAYQKGDHSFTAAARFLAMVFAVLLAISGGVLLDGGVEPWLKNSTDVGLSLMVGILATPLAPIAKDLSSALATAVNTMQMVKR